LVSFKSSGYSEKLPAQLLIEYCRDVLGAVERFHVDFKQKQNRSHSRLDDSDKKNLAKAISGFANSGGGVLIWGFEDKTMASKPISNVQKFTASLLEMAPHTTDPIVPKIDGDWILSGGPEQEGFGLLFVPESSITPHRVILNQDGVKNHYFTRSGDSFVVASHTQLEDMFGRRPKPDLALNTRILYNGRGGEKINLYVILGIENRGRGAAKSPYLSLKIHKPYNISEFGIDGNKHFGLTVLKSAIRTEEQKYGSMADMVIHSGIVHDVTAITVDVDVAKPSSNIFDLIIDYKIAAEGISCIDGRKVITGQEIWDAVIQLS
jgi:hypothetical protein